MTSVILYVIGGIISFMIFFYSHYQECYDEGKAMSMDDAGGMLICSVFWPIILPAWIVCYLVYTLNKKIENKG